MNQNTLEKKLAKKKFVSDYTNIRIGDEVQSPDGDKDVCEKLVVDKFEGICYIYLKSGEISTTEDWKRVPKQIQPKAEKFGYVKLFTINQEQLEMYKTVCAEDENDLFSISYKNGISIWCKCQPQEKAHYVKIFNQKIKKLSNVTFSVK